jgi:hypothetical protein
MRHPASPTMACQTRARTRTRVPSLRPSNDASRVACPRSRGPCGLPKAPSRAGAAAPGWPGSLACPARLRQDSRRSRRRLPWLVGCAENPPFPFGTPPGPSDRTVLLFHSLPVDRLLVRLCSFGSVERCLLALFSVVSSEQQVSKSKMAFLVWRRVGQSAGGPPLRSRCWQGVRTRVCFAELFRKTENSVTAIPSQLPRSFGKLRIQWPSVAWSAAA